MPAIIILGGHRSGTSVTTRLIHELGFPAAPAAGRLLSAHPVDNPDGYYEDTAFVNLHRRMLGEHKLAEGGWKNPRRDDAEILRLRPEYLRRVSERQAASRDWCLKDPRLCLVGDVLLGVLEELAIKFRIVTTPRAIDEVVASLRRRGLRRAMRRGLRRCMKRGGGRFCGWRRSAGWRVWRFRWRRGGRRKRLKGRCGRWCGFWGGMKRRWAGW